MDFLATEVDRTYSVMMTVLICSIGTVQHDSSFVGKSAFCGWSGDYVFSKVIHLSGNDGCALGCTISVTYYIGVEILTVLWCACYKRGLVALNLRSHHGG